MIYHLQSKANSLLVPLFVSGHLIPFFGAGFTMNEKCGPKSLENTVPDGRRCTELFEDLLKRKDPERKYSNSLADVSVALFKSIKHDGVSINEFLELLQKYFMNVQVDGIKKEFLNLPWHTAFTINIDDGIEGCSDFRPILPYKNTRSDVKGKVVYKIHGDAKWEVDYEAEDNLVFNFDQYINSISLPTNQTLREAILSAMKDENLLYIGCSLQDEPDLRHLNKLIANDDRNAKKNIMLCGKKPDKYYEESLQDDYGITDIIIVEDYSSLYSSFITEIHSNAVEAEIKNYKYSNPEIEDTKDIKYFTGFKTFDENKNIFYRSEFFVYRDIIDEIDKALIVYPVVYIEGRRFSGKTILLELLIERERTRKIVYFPSESQIDTDVVRRLFNESNNCLFLFDTNSMLSETYFSLKEFASTCDERNNRIIIAINQSDSYLSDIGENTYFKLSQRFTQRENNALNSVVTGKGYIDRRLRDTNLNYLEILNQEQKIPIAVDISYDAKFTLNEKILLMILCARDKIYSKDYSISLNISNQEIDTFLKKLSLAVEKVRTTKNETKFQSGFKLVHNSSAVITRLVRKIDRRDVIQGIRNIVSSFKEGTYEQKRIYKEVLMFDTLNQMFSDPSKGAGHLIEDVYRNLEDLMGDDLHFWIQRSKSIYRLNPGDYAELMKAYMFAKKVYNDADENYQDKLKKQSALSISLICTLLSHIESDKNEKVRQEMEAIDRGYESIFSKYYKEEKYIKSVLTDSRKNYVKQIIEVCDNVGRYSERGIDVRYEIVERAIQIKYKMMSICG